MDPKTLIEIVKAAKGLNLNLCDIYRMIDWNAVSIIASRTDNKIDDVVVKTLATVLSILCKD